jgi:hypothetical protein
VQLLKSDSLFKQPDADMRHCPFKTDCILAPLQIVAKTLSRERRVAMILLIVLSRAAQMIASTIAITKSTAAPNSRSSPSSDHMPPPPGMATQQEAAGSVVHLIRLW